MADTTGDGLTDKQSRFVEEYLVDFNATQAAIRAGYSVDTAYSIGWENLRKPVIAARIAELGQKTADELGMTREYVLVKLREVVEKSLQGAPKTTGKGEIVYGEDGQAIIEWSPSGARGALELLAKLRGDLAEKVIHEGGIDIRINGVPIDRLT